MVHCIAAPHSHINGHNHTSLNRRLRIRISIIISLHTHIHIPHRARLATIRTNVAGPDIVAALFHLMMAYRIGHEVDVGHMPVSNAVPTLYFMMFLSTVAMASGTL